MRRPDAEKERALRSILELARSIRPEIGESDYQEIGAIIANAEDVLEAIRDKRRMDNLLELAK